MLVHEVLGGRLGVERQGRLDGVAVVGLEVLQEAAVAELDGPTLHEELRGAQAVDHGLSLDGSGPAAVAGVVAAALLRADADPQVARGRLNLVVIHHEGDGEPHRLILDEVGLVELRVDHEAPELEIVTAPLDDDLHESPPRTKFHVTCPATQGSFDAEMYHKKTVLSTAGGKTCPLLNSNPIPKCSTLYLWVSITFASLRPTGFFFHKRESCCFYVMLTPSCPKSPKPA